MLSSAVVLPESLMALGGHPRDALALLQDLAEWGGVLLVDDDERGLTGMYQAIGSLPPEIKLRAVKLLDGFGHERRLVHRTDAPTATSHCMVAGCDQLRSVARTSRPDWVFCEGDCCTSCETPSVRIEEYGLFRDEERKRLRSPRDFASSAKEMQVGFLVPALRFSRSLRLYDRIIGRHLQNQALQGGDRAVAESFSGTIRWLLDIFTATSDIPGKELTLVTGLVGEGDLGAERDALARFRDALQQSYGMPVKLELARERRGPTGPGTLRHQRFLITDHAAYQVDPGFDFLIRRPTAAGAGVGARADDGEICPTTVARFPDAARIASENLLLPQIDLQGSEW